MFVSIHFVTWGFSVGMNYCRHCDIVLWLMRYVGLFLAICFPFQRVEYKFHGLESKFQPMELKTYRDKRYLYSSC